MQLRPMLATPSSAASGRSQIAIESLSGTHVFDVKMDGIRAFASWDGGRLTLTNRNQVDITAKYPELVESFEASYVGPPIVIDGEIMAEDGRFETVLTRDKQSSRLAIDQARKTMPTRFYAFDVPSHGDRDWQTRRALLESLVLPERWERTLVSYDPGFLAQTASLGLEGVIAKRLGGRYEFGARSKSWVKFKNLHHVTCLVSGYAAGTGSRAHFGAMFLSLVSPTGEIVPAGRVGTGMSRHEIDDLKARLDRQEVLVIEVECLGVTSGNTLRMPVYRGIRTDVGVLAASTTQLDSLPRS